MVFRYVVWRMSAARIICRASATAGKLKAPAFAPGFQVSSAKSAVI